ncbi:MAG: alpha/beta hydrolase [Deltaproteobacteria bacterium]
MSLKFVISRPPKREVEQEAMGFRLNGTNKVHVLLVHGLTGTPVELYFLAGFLNRKGYSVTCPCLANHGRHIEILKKTTWQDCYASVIGALEEIPDAEPVYACGLSMGALLALLLSIDFPHRVQGVCAISPTLFYDGWNMPWYRSLLRVAYLWPLRDFLYFKEESPYGIKNTTIRDAVDRQYRESDFHDTATARKYGYPYFPLALLYQLDLLVRFLTARLPSVTAPVQLIQALDDDMTSLKNSQFIYDSISSDTKELAIFNDSYHVITADQERQKVALKIDEFFRRCRESGERVCEALPYV